MTCATSTLKFTLFILNLLCCIAAGLMISASAYALVTFEASNTIKVPCIVGIILGSCLLLATILGCCGAARESIRFTWIYALILLVIVCAQIAVNFFISMDFHKLADETITNAWNRQLTEPGIMEKYETKFYCCGKTGSEDYVSSGLQVPASCYKHHNSTVPADLYTEGCIDSLAEAFKTSSRIENITDWSLVGIEGFTILLTVVLALTLRNVERRRLYH